MRWGTSIVLVAPGGADPRRRARPVRLPSSIDRSYSSTRLPATRGVASRPDEPRRCAAGCRRHDPRPAGPRGRRRDGFPRRGRGPGRARPRPWSATVSPSATGSRSSPGTSPRSSPRTSATLAAGAVAVPLNPAAPAQELAREFERRRAGVVARVERARGSARRASTRCDAPMAVFVLDAEASDAHRSTAAGRTRGRRLAVLLFTAGTAGPPKAAMLTHGSLLANLEQMQGHPGLQIRADDVALGVLPFFHIFGLNVVLDLALHGRRGGLAGFDTSIRPKPSPACATTT